MPIITRPRIFYGWWIVFACFIIAMYMSGVVFYGFTAIFRPIAEEFGWSYTEVSVAAAIRGLEAGVLAPVAGILVDRWGPRRVIFGGVLLVGAGLLLLSGVTTLAMFYVAFILMSLGISSCGISVTVTAVSNWFRKRVGLASGIMIAGYGTSGILVPVMVKLIDIYDWRTAVAILAVGFLVIGLPLSLVIRHKPERYGYLPDGDSSPTVLSGESVLRKPASEASITTREAFKSRTIWHIILGLMPQFVVVPAAVTHLMPYLSSVGIQRSLSSLVATAIPLLSVGGRFGFGWLADKYEKRKLSAIGLFSLAAGLALFEYISAGTLGLIVPFLILFGVGYGANVTMVGTILQENFGRGNFGTIIGLVWGILMLGNIAGPLIAGAAYDNWGSYRWVWLGMAGLVLVGTIIVLLTPPFRKK
jgi:MFS family permease